MIKCPGCGRTYSNLVKVCPACKTALNSQSQELPQYGSSENSSTVKPQPNNAGVTCPNCGATVQVGAKFCGSCGSNVMGESTSTAQKMAQTIAVPVSSPTSANSNQNHQQSQVNSTQSNQYKTNTNEENIFKQFFTDITSFNFNGRMNRAKYWKFAFIGIGFIMVLGFVLGLVGIGSEVLYNLIGLVYAILTLPFTVRRFHDLNKSGWWTVLCLIPVICIIPNIYIGFFKGTDGPNQYGPDPLQQI